MMKRNKDRWACLSLDTPVANGPFNKLVFSPVVAPETVTTACEIQDHVPVDIKRSDFST